MVWLLPLPQGLGPRASLEMASLAVVFPTKKGLDIQGGAENVGWFPRRFYPELPWGHYEGRYDCPIALIVLFLARVHGSAYSLV